MIKKPILIVLMCGLLIAITPGSAFADDQPPTPLMGHSATHVTQIASAMDQPGVPTTTRRQNFGRLDGKRHQVVRGIYPVTEEFVLYINSVSINPTDSSGLSAKGLEIKIACTIRGGGFKKVMVESRYVDSTDIPKLQQFIDTMASEATSPNADGDSASGSYLTKGGTTLSYQRNGKDDTDFQVANDSVSAYTFDLKSPSDMAVLKKTVDDAADSLAAPATSKQ